MNFCSNCGSKLETDVNFCPNCGNKIFSSQNKIDKSYEHLKGHAQSVKKEIENSYVVANVKSNANKVITEEIPLFFGKVIWFTIHAFGIIGLLVIVFQILAYFITGDVSQFDEAYINWKNYHSYDNLSFFSIFIAQIMPSTILPFLFMFLSGFRKKWLLNVAVILVVFILLIRVLDSERVYKFEEEQKTEKEM